MRLKRRLERSSAEAWGSLRISSMSVNSAATQEEKSGPRGSKRTTSSASRRHRHEGTKVLGRAEGDHEEGQGVFVYGRLKDGRGREEGRKGEREEGREEERV